MTNTILAKMGLLKRKRSEKEMLFSNTPSDRTISLADSLTSLKQDIEQRAVLEPMLRARRHDLDQFEKSHPMHLDRQCLETLSWDHALKTWALERWNSLRLPYSINNNLKQQATLESKPVQELLKLAEAQLQITHFCRSLQSGRLEISHSANELQCQFEYIGSATAANIIEIESKGMEVAIAKSGLNADFQNAPGYAQLTIRL